MVTITSHIFINIFQTVHFQLKNSPGVIKKWVLSSDTKISQSLKKSEAIGLGSFNDFLQINLTKCFPIKKNRNVYQDIVSFGIGFQ